MLSPPREFVFIKSTSDHFGLHKVDCDDIVAFEAMRNCVIVHLGSTTLRTYLPISKIAELFSNDPRFIQVHRSFIISINHISILRRTQIIMDTGLRLLVGELYKTNFEQFVSAHLLNGNADKGSSTISE